MASADPAPAGRPRRTALLLHAPWALQFGVAGDGMRVTGHEVLAVEREERDGSGRRSLHRDRRRRDCRLRRPGEVSFLRGATLTAEGLG